ncbi:hypothetical protein [Rhizobium leguminosarum]|jgi:hypothetical protein|uniref:hypothetical protein n=1 Tax=Rhizobium leguminosarum TaxID=384 RepID=UPI00144244D3|nr:hypothetical protein [Rhizobium leguminosarum]MBY3026509.1 hypothetical protein [Rhizobium leguminosarum]NKL74117.1 hypothetical protein [Rhizobium leguminosarum bv. viciae]
MGPEEYVSAGAARTARWRAAVKRRSIPETDDLDTAIASAFSAFVGHYQRSGLLEHQQAANGMVLLIGKALQDAGYCGDEALRRAENRLYYLQMTSRYPDASATAKRRWELGPPDPESALMEHDFDPTYEGDYDPTDEDAYNE